MAQDIESACPRGPDMRHLDHKAAKSLGRGMRKHLVLLGISASTVAALGLARAADTPPIWAYPVAAQSTPSPPPDNTVLKSLPGSKLHFTDAGVGDRFNVPDWFPASHPPMPQVVAHGRKPDVYA